jgi:pimeloyl-ACP methyl ester carboxylesterase
MHHVSSALVRPANARLSVVKDHEAVRVALGNVPFNYLGLSYGTQIGAQYAALFPDNVRTLALDGVVQHSQSEATNILIDSSAYSVALTSFFKWASENETSVLKGQNVEELWMNLLANATAKPIPAAGCNGTLCSTDVTGEEILMRAQGMMTFKDGGFGLAASWKSFASALYNATQGDATVFSPLFADNPTATMHSVTCLDWTNTPTLAASLQKQSMGAAYTPLVNGSSQSWQYQHQCMGWPFALKNPPMVLDVKMNATALLVHSDRDPSTGYPWALGMRKEIKNSVLVTRLGDGHTSFTLGGQAAGVILKYLITGKAPEDGMTVTS